MEFGFVVGSNRQLLLNFQQGSDSKKVLLKLFTLRWCGKWARWAGIARSFLSSLAERENRCVHLPHTWTCGHKHPMTQVWRSEDSLLAFILKSLVLHYRRKVIWNPESHEVNLQYFGKFSLNSVLICHFYLLWDFQHAAYFLRLWTLSLKWQ